MFKHMLVPLDGSPLAESVLPAVAYLAVLMDSTVTLIHIIEKNAPQEIHGYKHLTNPEEASAYLREIAQKAFPPELKVVYHVHTEGENNVARSIADHAGEFKPDLIVMCTHGRSGLYDFLFGSIAQQVISLGQKPVLLLFPSSSADQKPFVCKHILVPLDGSSEHSQGLEVAIKLAELSSAGIHLVIVVPTLGTLKSERAAAGRLLPATMSVMLDMAEEEAQTAILRQVSLLQSANVPVTSDVHRGDPAKIIADEAQIHGSDMIILATHGKSGQKAFWAESVAPKVARLIQIPLLFVPIQEG